MIQGDRIRVPLNPFFDGRYTRRVPAREANAILSTLSGELSILPICKHPTSNSSPSLTLVDHQSLIWNTLIETRCQGGYLGRNRFWGSPQGGGIANGVCLKLIVYIIPVIRYPSYGLRLSVGIKNSRELDPFGGRGFMTATAIHQKLPLDTGLVILNTPSASRSLLDEGCIVRGSKAWRRPRSRFQPPKVPPSNFLPCYGKVD